MRSNPLLPVKMVEFGGEINVREVAVSGGEERIEVGRVGVRTGHLPHPGHTLGFRVEADGRSLVYIPDHRPRRP